MSEDTASLVKWVCPNTYGRYSTAISRGTFQNALTKGKVKRNNWQQLVAAKRDATNSYSLSELTLQSPCLYEVIIPDYGGKPATWGSGSVNVVQPLSLGTFNPDLGSDLRDKYKQAMSSLNAVLLLAEDAKEFRGLVSAMADQTTTYLKAAERSIDSFIRRRPTRYNKAEVLASLSDSWLTWSFGLAPLLGTAESVANSIAATLAGEQANVVIGSSAETSSSSYVKLAALEGSSSTWGGQFYLSAHHVLEAKTRYTYGLNPSVTSIASGASTFGLGSLTQAFNTLTCTAWELIPYSWVVDYFTTAGDFVDGVSDFSPIVGLIYGCKSELSRCSTTFYPIVIGSTSLKMVTSGVGKIDRVSFKRTPITSFPTPQLRFKTMDEIAVNSVNRLLNLASCVGGKGKLLSRLIS